MAKTTIAINISAPELTEAINNLAGAMTALAEMGAAPVLTAEEPVQETKRELGSGPEPEPEPETPTVTLEQVRAKLAALARDGKQAEVKKLINKYGASKLTDIPADKYAELLADAEDL